MKVYTVSEVCAILRCSRASVNAMIKARALKSPMRGRVTVASVDAFLDDGRPWQEIAAEKRAAVPAKAPSGTTPKRTNGAGVSDGTAKITPSLTLIDRGQKLNLKS
jgi:hypothetical protein